jgi:thiol-disulfide isomerase/thioredoxin
MKASLIKAILAIVFCCVWEGVYAQNIQFLFPQFTGKQYVFVLNEGLKKDTVQSGVVGENGSAVVNLAIPEKYKGYTGIGSWSTNDGVNIQFIVDSVDFSVTCRDSIPNPHNIIYEGSAENERKGQYETELNMFYQKLDSIYRKERITAKNRYTPPPSFLGAMQSASREYAGIRERLVSDTSYAAYYVRNIIYFQQGLGDRLYYKPNDEKAYLDDFMRYFTEEIDMVRLYYSGLWSPTITTTFTTPEYKPDWGKNMVKALDRIKSQRIFELFSVDLISICEQFDLPAAEETILTYLESSGRLPDDPFNYVNTAVLQNKVKIGNKAPLLEGIEAVPAHALLIFYESGCTHCQHQLSEITKHYSQIVEKGIRVIAISTDESKEVFEFHSKNFPWPDRLCDLQGFRGENLKNYGVIGTPTLFLIDENGIILDKQPRLENIKALNLY